MDCILSSMPFWLSLGLGLGLLIAGAEALIRGASGLALRWGVSPLLIGLTIVAFGTGAPEAIISVGSALTGRPEIAVGNVLGSNILNVFFILGASALATPLAISRQLQKVDVPIMIALSLLAWILSFDGSVGLVDSIALIIALVWYTALSIRLGRQRPSEPDSSQVRPVLGWPWLAAGALLGLALLGVGARLFVEGSVELARLLGVSELVIGLTIVAAGTSLPEAATSIVAAIRREREIAVGNIVGSNIFNLTGVLGPTGLLAGGIAVPEPCLRLDFPAAVAAAAICLPVFLSGSRISRSEGALLLAGYGVYLAILIRGA
jgi:cation:H+ antiporter